MDFSQPQTSNPLRRRLQWWLLIAVALGIVCLVAFWPADHFQEIRVFAAATVILLALGILVDQMLLSPPASFDHSSSRDALLELNQRLVIEAHTDALTGLYNRRGLEAFFHGLVSTPRFRHRSIAVLMIDVDQFKLCNDQYGHPVGDQMLLHVAGLLRSTLRRSDGMSRWGGDEFCVILPNTALSQAIRVARKLCLRLATNPLALALKESSLRIEAKASIGVVAVDTVQAFSLDAFIAGADKALYQAKASGGNAAVGMRLD